MHKITIGLAVFGFILPVNAGDLTLEKLYRQFNMRSVNSTFGPRLKYYCESYPVNFFPASARTIDAATKSLTLSSGDDVWIFKLIGSNTIALTNAITTGTYRSSIEYEVYFDSQNNDWRAKETYIAIPEDCVTFVLRADND